MGAKALEQEASCGEDNRIYEWKRYLKLLIYTVCVVWWVVNAFSSQLLGLDTLVAVILLLVFDIIS